MARELKNFIDSLKNTIKDLDSGVSNGLSPNEVEINKNILIGVVFKLEDILKWEYR